MKSKLFELKEELESTGKAADKLEYALDAYLGVLGHYRSYHIRRELMLHTCDFSRYGCFNRDMKKFYQFAPQ